MTGYGQGSAELDGWRVTVELRSVNNRFVDVRLRLPQELSGVEAEIRRRVLSLVRRGRVELAIKLEHAQGAEVRPTLNRELLEEVVRARGLLEEAYGLEGSLDRGTVLTVPGMFRAEPIQVTWDDAERRAVERALDQALQVLDDDRRREGQKLSEDLLQRLRTMRSISEVARKRAATLPPRIRDRLQDRLATLGGEIEIDPARVAQEAAILADRCDVTEELVRLDGHLEQALALVGEPDGEPLGKRLEFLLQEIHRETNTLSSKSVDLELTRHALDLKLEAEKIREQVQNLE
jgi:uncharacterized protein (TIGR00255 family)